MPVQRRTDDDRVRVAHGGNHFVKLVARKGLTVAVDAVIRQVQRLVRLAVCDLRGKRRRVAVLVRAAVDKKHVHGCVPP